jgi:hypothetical protein
VQKGHLAIKKMDSLKKKKKTANLISARVTFHWHGKNGSHLDPSDLSLAWQGNEKVSLG